MTSGSAACSEPAPARSPGGRHQFRTIGIAALALVLVGVVTWFVAHGSRRAAHPGDLFADSQFVGSLSTASRSVVVLEPWGSIDVRIGSPRRTLPRSVTDDQGNQQAPGAGRFVPVEWQAMLADTSRPVSVAPYPRTHLSLVSGGKSYPLDTRTVAADPCSQPNCSGTASDNSVWVAVPGAADHLTVAAEFDGVTQTVDVDSKVRHPGRAAGLYASTAGVVLSPECGAVHLPAGYRLTDDEIYGGTESCHLYAYRSPYAPGHGWAPAGREWVVVDPQLDPPIEVVAKPHGGVPALTYRTAVGLEAAPVTARLAGAQDVGRLVTSSTDLTNPVQAVGDTAVFSIPATAAVGALTLTVQAPLVLEYADPLPASVRPLTITLSWTVQP